MTPYETHVQQVQTGKVRTIPHCSEHDDFTDLSTPQPFKWFTEGAASCDCVREMWFKEDGKFNNNVQGVCSVGRYRVRLTAPNEPQAILYDEWTDNAAENHNAPELKPDEQGIRQ